MTKMRTAVEFLCRLTALSDKGWHSYHSCCYSYSTVMALTLSAEVNLTRSTRSSKDRLRILETLRIHSTHSYMCWRRYHLIKFRKNEADKIIFYHDPCLLQHKQCMSPLTHFKRQRRERSCPLCLLLFCTPRRQSQITVVQHRAVLEMASCQCYFARQVVFCRVALSRTLATLDAAELVVWASHGIRQAEGWWDMPRSLSSRTTLLKTFTHE